MLDEIDDPRRQAEKMANWHTGTIEVLGLLRLFLDSDKTEDYVTRTDVVNQYNSIYSSQIEEGEVAEMTRSRAKTRLELLVDQGYATRTQRAGDGAYIYRLDLEERWRDHVARGVAEAMRLAENPIAADPFAFHTLVQAGAYNELKQTTEANTDSLLDLWNEYEDLLERVEKLEKFAQEQASKGY